MVLLPGNNPLDVEVRAEERAVAHEHRAEALRAEHAASRSQSRGRTSVALRITRWLRLR